MSAGRRTGRKSDRPAEGTKVRKLYDALMSGEWISVRQHYLGSKGSDGRIFAVLRDFYGLELETRRGGNGGTRLLGQWDGDYFIPVERMDRDI